ncbi:AGE family epimerase/isomerase [Cysteiniphilum sp. 6C5]|uniref:AGE family epimerase/isomerase n=1 Tax=unclassified Cysteiniphilum TaxID=2610889 RepID=UPI003F86D38D
MTAAIGAYYQLLTKAIDQLGYAPEFLNAPQKIGQANTRLLCQTRSLFFLLTYGELTNTHKANAYAYKLYQVMKSQYFDEQKKVWIKTQSSKDDNDLYEYAFVLFALSRLYGTFKESVIRADIEHVNKLITEKFIVNDFKALKDDNGVIGQNALMHLFEAYLNAYCHTQDSTFKTQAEALYRQIITLFFDNEKHLMREYSKEAKSALFEPGHSFEWSSLSVEAKALKINLDVMDDHARLYQAAANVGINDHGVVKPNLSSEVKEMQYRIWPMLEYMRYLAMTANYEVLDHALSIFSKTFLKHDLPIEYVDHAGVAGFDDVKSTTGYHLVNCWQYMLR